MTKSTNDHACAALIHYFVKQIEPQSSLDRTARLPVAIQLPKANVLVMIRSAGAAPTGAQLKQLSVDYARDVLFVRPGPDTVVPIVSDAVFATQAGPLLLTNMAACRLSADLLWLVPPDSALRVSLSRDGMRLVPRPRWWAGVDFKAGRARAHAEMASVYRECVERQIATSVSVSSMDTGACSNQGHGSGAAGFEFGGG